MQVSRCPLCKTEQFESNLKRVILLEEIVLCFQALRPALLELLAGTEEKILATPDAEVIEVSDGEKLSLGSPKTTPKLSTPVGDQVLCPVCSESMSAEYLQRSHLDDCLSGKKKASPKRKRTEIALFFKKKPKTDHEQFYFSQPDKHHPTVKTLPKVDFASLSTPKLKEKLASLKLATLGTRSQLELRYNHYYILHNANLDSNRPVSDLALRQKLNQWEKSHLAFAAPIATSTLYGASLSHKNISDKDFPVAAWVEQYKDEFRTLVKAAKKSAKASKMKKIEASEATSTIASSSSSILKPDSIVESSSAEITTQAGESGPHSDKVPEISLAVLQNVLSTSDLATTTTAVGSQNSKIAVSSPVPVPAATVSSISEDEVLDFSTSTLFKTH